MINEIQENPLQKIQDVERAIKLIEDELSTIGLDKKSIYDFDIESRELICRERIMKYTLILGLLYRIKSNIQKGEWDLAAVQDIHAIANGAFLAKEYHII